jgi:hypothetical protein
MPKGPVTLSVKGDKNMGITVNDFPKLAEMGNLSQASSNLAVESGAAAGSRVRRWDQLAADAASMWAVALTSPTVMAAHGMRVASEAGAGRTRVEANTPAGTQTVGE